MPGGRIGADVLSLDKVNIQLHFQNRSIPLPQPHLKHGWHLVDGTPGRGELVPRPAGLGGRVGGGEQLPDLPWRLLSLVAQPGGMVPILIAVVDHLAGHCLILPLLLPLPLLASLSRLWQYPWCLVKDQLVSFCSDY